jgi:hypothetical protein
MKETIELDVTLWAPDDTSSALKTNQAVSDVLSKSVHNK